MRATWSFGARPCPQTAALDLLRRVGGARHAAQRGRQHHDAARLPDREGAVGVLPEVHVLEREGVDLVLGGHVEHAPVDQLQAPLGASSARVAMTPPSSAARRPLRRMTTP